jgi:hypothetical protein
MATAEKAKMRNRSYLRKVFRIKTFFYPLLLVFQKTGLPVFLERFMNRVVLLFGVNKNVHYFFKYRDFGKLFRNEFKAGEKDKGDLIFPMMSGANNNFTMLNLMFASYFKKEDGLNPVFYVCDGIFDICTRDGLLRPRDKYPWICFECSKGYDYISGNTGIEIVKMSGFRGADRDIVAEEIDKIDGLHDLSACLGYKLREIELGQLTYKTILRYFVVGSLSGTAHQVQIYKEFLKSAVIFNCAFERFIDSRKEVKAVIIYNGTLVFDTIVIHHCRNKGITFVTYENFYGHNSLIYKKNGEVMNLDWSKEYNLFVSGKNTPPDMEAIVEKFFSGLKRGDQMYAVLNKEHSDERLKNAGRYACLFTNLNYDTAVIGKNYLFESMEDWIFAMIKYWHEHKPEPKLVIRIHPGEVKLVTATSEFTGERIKKAAGSDENIIIFDSTDKVNSYELINGMDYSMIYSSTIGLETAWAGKPCVVAGIPWFRNSPFVISPSDIHGYFNTIELLNKGALNYVPDRDELIKSVYFNYFCRTKRFEGIKLRTPREEPNCSFSNSKEMIAANTSIFKEFRDELFDSRI